eukprot:TRINITY_DN18187_c0_g1_i1.p1 TRINITY_DN18187_c0_g1~~TRINITY_DN18187_c0_g1_i1.p1  ORF type:complete len:135 (-),score=14.60 TRINITY_DN18187_c0_g1_i1:5-409(-)
MQDCVIVNQSAVCQMCGIKCKNKLVRSLEPLAARSSIPGILKRAPKGKVWELVPQFTNPVRLHKKVVIFGSGWDADKINVYFGHTSTPILYTSTDFLTVATPNLAAILRDYCNTTEKCYVFLICLLYTSDAADE